MADITFKGRGRAQPEQDPVNLTEEERTKHRLEWQSKHPFAPDSAMPNWMRAQDSSGVAPQSTPPTDTGSWEPSPMNLGDPSPYVIAALAKPANQRSLQEVEAIRVRRGVEEQTMRSGGRVKGGITPGLIASEKAAEQGRFDATAGLAYNRAKNDVLAQAGFSADGTPLPAGQPAAAVAPRPTSGGTMIRNGVQTTVPGAPAQPDQATQKPAGFAMRTMADGTVKTASGVDPSGSSIMRSFDTKEEALALFRPAQPPQAQATTQVPAAPGIDPGMTIDPATLGTAKRGPGLEQAAGWKAPYKNLTPGASTGQVRTNIEPGKATAPLRTNLTPGMPIASPQDEKTTSPTTRFEMATRTMGTPMIRGTQVMAEKLNPFSSSFRF